jgi:hypothetical protein
VGLRTTASLVVQPAQPMVAVGDERAHAQLLGQGQGLLVVGFGLYGIGGIGAGMAGAELAERECLVPAFLILPSQVSTWRDAARPRPTQPARR